MRTVVEIKWALKNGESITPGERTRLTRFEAREAKRRAYWAEQDRRDDLAYQRQQRAQRQAEAERRHQAALEAAARIHRATPEDTHRAA